MEEEDPPMSSFFKQRASAFSTKKTAADIKAAEELVNKFEEEEKLKPAVKRKKKDCKKYPLESTSSSFTADMVAGQSSTANMEVGSVTDKKVGSPSTEKVDSPSTSSNIDFEKELKNVRLPAASRKRLKKMKEEHEFENKLLEIVTNRLLARSQRVTDMMAAEPPIEPIIDNTMHITVNYLSKIARFKCDKTKNFASVFIDVGKFFNLNPTQFLLCRKDRNICVGETPISLDLMDCELLECIPYIADENSEDIKTDGNYMKITFQSNDLKDKLHFFVHKLEKIQNIRERYSIKRDLPLENIIFEYDGEKLEGTETPTDLEMESGHCIDVRISLPAENKDDDKNNSMNSQSAECCITIESDDSDDTITLD